MTDSILDERLRSYLDREESERALGKTNEAILSAVARVSDALGEHKGDNIRQFAKVDARLDQHDYRLGSVEKTAAKVEAKADQIAEDTGNHRIVLAEAHGRRWDDMVWGVAKLALLALLGGGIVEVIHRAAGH